MQARFRRLRVNGNPHFQFRIPVIPANCGNVCRGPSWDPLGGSGGGSRAVTPGRGTVEG